VGGQAGIDATLDVLGVGHAVLKVAHAHARCLRVERARLTPEELQALVQALEGFGQLEPAYSCGELAGGEILDAPDVVFQVRRGEAAKRVRVADAVCWDRLPEPLVELTAALDRLVQAHFRNRPAAQDEAGRVE